MHSNLGDASAQAQEHQARVSFSQERKDYVSFLSQKAKLAWLKDGDANTGLFHKAIKMRQYRNTIYQVENMDQKIQHTPEGVSNTLFSFILIC